MLLQDKSVNIDRCNGVLCFEIDIFYLDMYLEQINYNAREITFLYFLILGQLSDARIFLWKFRRTSGGRQLDFLNFPLDFWALTNPSTQRMMLYAN